MPIASLQPRTSSAPADPPQALFKDLFIAVQTAQKRARSAGVSQEKIDQYIHLLELLGANETLASVYGLGKACLITADITVGLFDNSVIKGYVFAPSDPHPLH